MSRFAFYTMKSFAIASLVLMVYGCQMKPAQEHKGEMQNSDRQLLRINVQGDLASLNPHLSFDLNCRSMQKAIYEGLTRLSPDGKPELAGAMSYELSPSQTIYTFKLRPMQWSNGETVTAEHFEKTWKQAVTPNSNCLRADLFYPIKNAEAAKKGLAAIDEVGVKAIDERTLIVELEHPTPYFLDLLAIPIFSPIYPDGQDEPSVFNGPFLVDSWQHDSKLTLIRNPSYWDAASVKLNQIDISLVNDARTALLMYEKGEIDWVGAPFILLPLDAIPQLEQAGNLILQPVEGIFWFNLNTKVPALQSANIRKALAYALNRGEIAYHVVRGENPARTPAPTQLEIVPDKDLYTDGDIDAAKQFFEAGLAELKMTRQTFPTLKIMHSDAAGHKNIAQTAAIEWEKALGIHCEIIGYEWNVFAANLGRHDFDIGGLAYYFAYSDPNYTLEFFRDPTCKYNPSQWHNAHYVALLDRANAATDPKKRTQFLKEATLILLDEMPIIPAFSVNFRYLKRDTIQGVYLSPLGHADFKWASIKEPAKV